MRFTIATASLVSLGALGPQLPQLPPQPLPVAASAQASRSVWDGVYTIGQAKRGSVHTERCAPCHGFDLEGDSAPTLMGPVFTGVWNGRTLGDLFERIESNFKMVNKDQPPNNPELRNQQQAADFLAFVLLENQFPSGTDELPVGRDALRQIRFLASKP